MPLIFKLLSVKCAFFCRLFFLIIFAFTLAYRKSAFIELTSFKSLSSVKFKAFTLYESHHLLVKLFLRKRL